MFVLSIHSVGTTETVRSNHETLGDAHHALARFGRAYDIQGYGTLSGTLTTRSGRVNQASYVWHIRDLSPRWSDFDIAMQSGGRDHADCCKCRDCATAGS